MYLRHGLLSLLVGFVLLCLLSCRESAECVLYAKEIYPQYQEDSVMLLKAQQYRDLLLERFNETPVQGSKHNSYHFLYYCAHGYGKSIKVEVKEGAYFLTVKCVAKEGWPFDCNNYQVQISETEWNDFENTISRSDFWSAKRLGVRNENVLDGSVYIIEGNRPDAAKCDKRTYQFVGRQLLGLDTLDILYHSIEQYETALAAKYNSSK